MSISRRSFLKTAGIILAAPAIVKAENIMKIWTPPQDILTKDNLLVFVDGVIQSPGEFELAPDGNVRFDHKNAEYQIFNLEHKTWTRIMA